MIKDCITYYAMYYIAECLIFQPKITAKRLRPRSLAVSTLSCRCLPRPVMPSSLCLFNSGGPMPCKPEVLHQVPLFALLDDEETAVLANQVEVRSFAPRQRIYKMGDPGERAYVMVSGTVVITTVDEDGQEVTVDQPAPGEFFGFASMLEQTPHQTTAIAQEETVCIEVDRHD